MELSGRINFKWFVFSCLIFVRVSPFSCPISFEGLWGKRSFWASSSFKLSKTSEQHCTLSILFFVVLPSCGHISFGRTQYFTFVSIRMIAQRYSLCKGAMHWIQLSEVYHKKDLANSVQDLKKKIFSFTSSNICLNLLFESLYPKKTL